LASLSDDAHNSNVASIDALTDRSITKMNRVNQHDIKNATVMLAGPRASGSFPAARATLAARG